MCMLVAEDRTNQLNFWRKIDRELMNTLAHKVVDMKFIMQQYIIGAWKVWKGIFTMKMNNYIEFMMFGY